MLIITLAVIVPKCMCALTGKHHYDTTHEESFPAGEHWNANEEMFMNVEGMEEWMHAHAYRRSTHAVNDYSLCALQCLRAFARSCADV